MFLDNDACAGARHPETPASDVRGAAIFDTRLAEFARYGGFVAEGRLPSLSTEHAHFRLDTPPDPADRRERQRSVACSTSISTRSRSTPRFALRHRRRRAAALWLATRMLRRSNGVGAAPADHTCRR